MMDLFVKDIWSKHNMLTSFMSDKKLQFVLKIQDLLCKLLKIEAKLSTAHYPETNSQSEIANQKAKQHLQIYVNHFQNNWTRLLLMREFIANDNVSATIKILLFLATKGYNLIMSFDLINLFANFTHKRIANVTVRSIASRTEKI